MKLQLRTAVPLAVLHSMDGHIITRTRMMKLSFLTDVHLRNHHVDVAEEFDFEFYASEYGPYSEELVSDVQSLDSRDLVTVTEKKVGPKQYAYSMAPNVRRMLTESAAEDENVNAIFTSAEAVVNEYGEFRNAELIDHIHQEHPKYVTGIPDLT